MFLSASQIKIVFPLYKKDDDSHCKRKWFNKYIQKLPQPRQEFTKLGSALHGCVENYLNSADMESGDPFLDGWDLGLTGNQPEIVQELVNKSIEEGYVTKKKERHIEASIWDGKDHFETLKKLKPNWSEEEVRAAAKTCWEIVPGVLITGFIDYMHSGNTIMDWKTSSNPERYGLNLDEKSTKYIGYDVQLLLYATWLRKVKNVEGPINIGHTYFQTRNTLKISSVSSDIQPCVLDAFFDWLVTTVIPEFQSLSKMEESQVKTLPVGGKACEKYRGCPYQRLCSESVTKEEYIKIQELNMSLMDKIKNKAKETTEEKVEKVEPKVLTNTDNQGGKEFKPVPAGGFELILGSSVRSTKSDFTTLTSFFNEVTAGILAELGESDWWSLDPFNRRTLFIKGKEEIIKMAAGKRIVCRFLEPDCKALLNVLIDEAETVIEGNMG